MVVWIGGVELEVMAKVELKRAGNLQLDGVGVISTWASGWMSAGMEVEGKCKVIVLSTAINEQPLYCI